MFYYLFSQVTSDAFDINPFSDQVYIFKLKFVEIKCGSTCWLTETHFLYQLYGFIYLKKRNVSTVEKRQMWIIIFKDFSNMTIGIVL